MNNDIWLVLDIETKPKPLTELKALGLIPPPKLGNVKDPEKIKEKLAAHEEESMETAALDATRSEVCAFGVATNKIQSPVTFNDVERQLITSIWEECRKVINLQGRIIGFNITGFDLPYLFRRSWILGIDPPQSLRRGRYWHDCVVDLMDVWSLGNREDRISLDRVCKACGLPGKNGSGKDFWKLLDTDPDKAMDYLRNDVDQTVKLAQKLGVIDESDSGI